jgi:hypothetical protein
MATVLMQVAAQADDTVSAKSSDTVEAGATSQETAAKILARRALKNAKAEEVAFFQAIEDGIIEVDFIPKDATQASVVFRNKTDKPLHIQLPATFAAVPVNAQMMGGMGGGGMGGMGGGGMGGMGGGGMGGGGMGGMGGGGMGGGQGMGGGMGGGGMGGGGMGGMGGMGGGGMGGGGMGGMGGGGMGGGMFRVQPDHPRKLKVATVCLEHGKDDPNPRMDYKIIKLEEFNNDPKIANLCALLGQNRIPQNTAQATAWHIANGLSWEELAHKPRVVSAFTGIELFFNRFELRNAFQLTQTLTKYSENQSESPYGDESEYDADESSEVSSSEVSSSEASNSVPSKG